MQTTLDKREEQNTLKKKAKFDLPESAALILLAAFWASCLAFVGLSGNFPINDDWIYAESVKHFLATGQLRLLACAPACIFQLVSSAAVCKIFGFNYVVLRGIGFFWAVLASFSMYGCCRQLRLKPAAALLLTMCFAGNPLLVNLAFTFMTDTPAIALTLAYSFFLLLGLRKQKWQALLGASVCLVAASCVRQNLGFLALVNFALLATMWLKRKHSWTLLLGLVVAPLAAGYLADKWMLATCDFTSLYTWYKGMVGQQVSHLVHRPGQNLPTVVQIAGELLTYLGLFLMPALVCFAPAFGSFLRNKGNISPVYPLVSLAVIMFSLSRFIIGEKRWMPFSQNMLRLPELGAHTILGINYVGLTAKWRENLTWLSGLAGFTLAVLLMDSVAKLCLRLWRQARGYDAAAFAGDAAKRRFGNELCAIAAILIFAFQFAFNTLQSTFSDIDRYYLFPLLGAILVVSLAWRWHRVRLIPFLAFPLVIAIAGYSVAATQDTMAWNRARWHAIEILEAKGINYKQIDGGSEYNYSRDPMLFKNLILHDTWYELTHRGEAPRDQWRWWSVQTEEYIISFSPVPGYEQIDCEHYWSALGGKRDLYALHRVDETPAKVTK